MKWGGIVAVLIITMAAFVSGWCLKSPAEVEVVKETRDTLYLRDTLIVEVAAAPCYIVQRVRDTIPVERIVTQTDTIFAEAERTTLRYEDSTYTAIVSGIRPKLDSLAIYPRKEVVTIHTTERVTVPKANRWGFGLQAGYGGVLADGKLATGPYIGVGISWNLATW